MLEVAIEAARVAGKILTSRFGHARLLSPKENGELLTEADLAAQAAILSILREQFPNHRFLAEEDQGPDKVISPEGSYWVIDPLDGTTNFAHGVPFFAVSIGYLAEGRVELGVVYDPLREELFHAQRGQGAYLNGQRLAVSGTEELAGAFLGTEWTQGVQGQILALMKLLAGQARSLRTLGAAALSLCYVAAGRMDLYFHPALKPWDVAAAGLIVEEAGGHITGLDGRVWNIYSRGYLAGNPELHQAALELIMAKGDALGAGAESTLDKPEHM